MPVIEHLRDTPLVLSAELSPREKISRQLSKINQKIKILALKIIGVLAEGFNKLTSCLRRKNENKYVTVHSGHPNQYGAQAKPAQPVKMAEAGEQLQFGVIGKPVGGSLLPVSKRNTGLSTQPV